LPFRRILAAGLSDRIFWRSTGLVAGRGWESWQTWRCQQVLGVADVLEVKMAMDIQNLGSSDTDCGGDIG